VTELGNVWHLSQSQSHAILKRLKNRGDISVQLVEQGKLHACQVLRFTSAGRQHFKHWLENGSGSNACSIRLGLLTRLYFSNLYTPKNTAKIYATQCAEIERLPMARRFGGSSAP
jgi:DNA-binding PadR family transcriptional regulator